jgi:DNA-binding transcriptional regulator YbjK
MDQKKKKTPVKIQKTTRRKKKGPTFTIERATALITPVEGRPHVVLIQNQLTVDDQAFWQCLYDANGIYAQAARLIEERYGVNISRVAVHNRAKSQPQILSDILEARMEKLEWALEDIALNGMNESARVAALKVALTQTRRGVERGYINNQVENQGVNQSANIIQNVFQGLSEDTLEALMKIGKQIHTATD